MSRAVVYEAIGSADVLHLAEVPDPEPGPGQVAVKVAVAGLNPFDDKMRSGFIPSEASFPRRIGSDFAGTVAAVGADAAYWDGSAVAVGDEVIGWGVGAMAERVVTSAGQLILRPANVPVEVAGGLQVAGNTALACLLTVPVGPEDTLLVGGASGGVGLLVCQLAVATGARVIGTASPRNHELLRSIGVIPVAYGEGLIDRLDEYGPFTAVIDCHGRDALDAGVALGVARERIGSIAGYAAIGELGVVRVERGGLSTADLAGLVDKLAAGTVVLPVAASYPLAEVQAAFRDLEGSHAVGKIVLTI